MKHSAAALILICGIVLSLPVILYGFPYPTHDGVIHEAWLANFSAQLWSGDLYPRWLLHMNGGLGSTAFFYYPPVPFYITSVFRPFFRTSPYAWHDLGLSAALGLIASGFFAYAWLSNVADKRSAAVGGVIYMLTPYHLGIDLYTRGAFAEFWSFTWMPLFLCGVHKVRDGRRTASILVAASYGLLLMTHLPAALLVSLGAPLYAWAIASPGSRARTVSYTLAAMTLGTGLAAIYLLPALFLRNAISIDTVAGSGHSFYANGFFFTNMGLGRFRLARDPFEKDLLWIFGGMLVAACSAAVVTHRSTSSPRVRTEGAFWLITIVVCGGMMTPVSKPVYHLVPPLQWIEFPWRFNAVACVGVTMLLALALATLRTRGFNRKPAGVVIAVCGLVWLILPNARLIAASGFTQRPGTASVSTVRSDLDQDRTEYKPRWVRSDQPRWTAANLHSILATFERPGDTLDKVKVVAGSGRAVAQKWEPRQIELLAHGDNDLGLDVAQFYFPGWTASVVGGESISVEPGPAGLIRLSVPRGRHVVHLQLGRTRLEWQGELLSILSVFMAIGAYAWLRRGGDDRLRAGRETTGASARSEFAIGARS